MKYPMPASLQLAQPQTRTPTRAAMDLTAEDMEAKETARKLDQRSAPIMAGDALKAGIQGGLQVVETFDKLDKREKAAEFQKVLDSKLEGMQAAYGAAQAEGITDISDPSLFATNADTILSWYKRLSESAGRKKPQDAQSGGASFDDQVKIAEQYGLLSPAQSLQYRKPSSKEPASPTDEKIKEKRLEGLTLSVDEKKKQAEAGDTGVKAKPPTFDPKGLRKNILDLDHQTEKTQKDIEAHEASQPNEVASPGAYKAWVKKRDRLMTNLSTFQRDRARYQARTGPTKAPPAAPSSASLTSTSTDDQISTELQRRNKPATPANIKAIRDRLQKAQHLGQ